ncbi:MAG: putative aminohydrolase SsnA [Anaerolineales bacterium]|jgi:putative selenium metabolism protein SsnA|nr:putative aminohydrolase SsnA [Anaerolineales bacterium]
MLITNATLITWERENRILPNSALLVRDGKIADFGPSAELMARYPEAALFDARGQLLLPGNICAHTHFYSTYSRGLASPGEPAARFSQILDKLWWPLDQALDEEATRLSARVCLVDAIKHGTTTLIDHHASPNFLSGSLNAIAEEVEKAGLRASLCYETTDRYGEAKMREAIDENIHFIKATANGSRPLLRSAFGLHAPLTISTSTLEACLEALAGLDAGIHIHVSESTDDRETLKKRGDGLPIAWLARHGALNEKSIIVHAVHVEQEEIRQLAESRAWVTHQPRSNMNNAVGVAKTEQMLKAGIRVCLGNDGFSNAMWEEWRAAYLLHKIAHEDPRRMGGYTVTEMAIYNNAALASQMYGMAIGAISTGAAADLMLVDYHPPTPLTAGNLPWHILFGFRESMVTGTIVNGQWLMKDRQLQTLDEAKIAAQARELAPKVWENYNKFVA